MVLGDRQGLRAYWGFFFQNDGCQGYIYVNCHINCKNENVFITAFFNYNYTKSCHRGTLNKPQSVNQLI